MDESGLLIHRGQNQSVKHACTYQMISYTKPTEQPDTFFSRGERTGEDSVWAMKIITNMKTTFDSQFSDCKMKLNVKNR